jgi:tetratricopeptide (TPR) repeat protein
LGRKEEARDAFRSALARDPDDAAALGNLAIVEKQLGDDEAALAHAQAAVRAAPGEAVFHYNLGSLLALRKRYEEALSSLQRAIAIDPKYAYAYNELGNVYLELGDPGAARKAFEMGLSCDHTVAKLHKNLARAALAEGHPEEAIQHLEKALSFFPPADSSGKTEAVYWLAAANAAAGRTARTCAALQEFRLLDVRLLTPFAQDATLLAKRHRCAPWP